MEGSPSEAGPARPEPAQPDDLSLRRVLVTGATSQIGGFLLPRLSKVSARVSAVSRSPGPVSANGRVRWIRANLESRVTWDDGMAVDTLIHLAPLPVLVPHLDSLAARGLRRVVAFSSTSALTKANSSSGKERAMAQRLQEAEAETMAVCARGGVACTLFRPTLIYGAGRDRNVSAIARFIRIAHCFLLVGKGEGLRQPVHADDLATACVDVIGNPVTWGKAYTLAGGEVLSYRAMVERIFQGMGLNPCFLRVPVGLLAAALRLGGMLPGQSHLSPAMAGRMNEDLVFDIEDARRDFGYDPRGFVFEGHGALAQAY